MASASTSTPSTTSMIACQVVPTSWFPVFQDHTGPRTWNGLPSGTRPCQIAPLMVPSCRTTPAVLTAQPFLLQVCW